MRGRADGGGKARPPEECMQGEIGMEEWDERDEVIRVSDMMSWGGGRGESSGRGLPGGICQFPWCKYFCHH